MTQAQFMYELMTAVHHLSDEAQYIIMQDYNEFFFNKKEEGLSEDEIISILPSPKTIAAEYKDGGMPLPVDGMKMTERAQPPSKPTALSTFLFILLIPLCVVYELLMLIGSIICVVLLFALCVAFALVSVGCFSICSLSAGFVVLGIGALIVTTAGVLLSAGMFKALWAGFLWFPKYINRVRLNKTKHRAGGKRK